MDYSIFLPCWLIQSIKISFSTANLVSHPTLLFAYLSSARSSIELFHMTSNNVLIYSKSFSWFVNKFIFFSFWCRSGQQHGVVCVVHEHDVRHFIYSLGMRCHIQPSRQNSEKVQIYKIEWCYEKCIVFKFPVLLVISVQKIPKTNWFIQKGSFCVATYLFYFLELGHISIGRRMQHFLYWFYSRKKIYTNKWHECISNVSGRISISSNVQQVAD